MAVSSIGASALGATPTTSGTQPNNNQADKNMFLKLLVAQLSNQDPLAPQDQMQYITQLAQFSTVEGINKVSDTQSRTQATSMLGKTVDAIYTVNNTQKAAHGTVTNIRFGDSGITVSIDGVADEVKLSDITNIQ